MYSLRRRILSQNFLHDRKLVESLIRLSSIGPHDTVLDIGAGKGIITRELLTLNVRVIAIEIDQTLCEYLVHKYSSDHNFQLISKDFLRYKMPSYRFKVFANIPFSIEGKIIRKLLTAQNPPDDCYLVIRRDLAERLAGVKKEGQFSMCYKPFFEFEILHYFRKIDFKPAARMDCVLLRFTKKTAPLLLTEDRKNYMMFVGQGFGNGRDLKYNLRSYISHEQFCRLSQKYKFHTHSRPSDLTIKQWIELFIFCKARGKI